MIKVGICQYPNPQQYANRQYRPPTHVPPGGAPG
jgi:hypothetical protein